MSVEPGSSKVASSPLQSPAAPSPADPVPPGTPFLSKKAAKRAAKDQRYAAQKLERRAREKEAKKEKKRLKAEKRAAGELDEDEDDQGRRQKRRKLDFGARVVVDLGFDSMMSTKEIKSLTSQLAFTYASNKGAGFPFDLLFTGFDGQTKERMDSLGDSGYTRWTKTEWWQEGFERLWQGDSAADHKPAADSESDTQNPYPGRALEPTDPIRQKIVYLTADSEDELTELLPDETYIIGGIVDHNRYKNLCQNKAKDHGVRTAKLPIGRYLASMPTRKVLTVNQCFEILVRWVDTRDWEDALYSVIPQRKFQGAGQSTTAGPVVVAGAVVVPVEEAGEESDGCGGAEEPPENIGEGGQDEKAS